MGDDCRECKGANRNRGWKNTSAARLGSSQQRLEVTVLVLPCVFDFWRGSRLHPARLLLVRSLEIGSASPRNAERCNICPWAWSWCHGELQLCFRRQGEEEEGSAEEKLLICLLQGCVGVGWAGC